MVWYGMVWYGMVWVSHILVSLLLVHTGGRWLEREASVAQCLASTGEKVAGNRETGLTPSGRSSVRLVWYGLVWYGEPHIGLGGQPGQVWESWVQPVEESISSRKARKRFLESQIWESTTQSRDSAWEWT